MSFNKPQINRILPSRSIFQSSTVTYNQAGLTYNDANTLYGGSDTTNDSFPSMGVIKIDKPVNSLIQNL